MGLTPESFGIDVSFVPMLRRMCGDSGARPVRGRWRSYPRAVARLLRSALPSEGTFHVTARGVDGASIFRDDDDRRFFLRELGRSARRHGWTCHVFCLMTNHYHLLVTASRDDLSAGLHRLDGIHALRFNRRHRRTGHLFGDRFASKLIRDDAHLRRAALYILNNPVRAGLCERASDWPWSGVDERTFAR